MICVSRTTVRGKYKIKGSSGTDCVLAFFLPPCTLVNMDREIRAREGHMKLRNSAGYAKYLRQQGIQTEQPGLNPPMAYLSPHPAQNPQTGNSTEPSNNRPVVSQAGASNPITRPSMAAVKNPGKHQKAQRRSKLSSAYLTPSDDDGEELLPQGKDKQRSMGNGNEYTSSSVAPRVLSPHSLENCETTFIDVPLTQHDLENCNKSATPLKSSPQHNLADCDVAGYSLGLLQHEIENCHVTTSPAKRAQHPLTQCENVAIDDPTSQHGLEQCQTTTSNVPQRQHLLEQCQVTTTSNAPQKQHKLERCESSPNHVSEKQHQLEQCVDTLPEIVSSQTSENHTLAVCEGSNGKDTEADDWFRKRDSYPQHVLADCPVELSGGKGCDSSAEDQKAAHHVAENAEISAGNSLENGVYTKTSMGAIKPEDTRQTRKDDEGLATSQIMPTITIPSDRQSRRQNQETRPKATSKGKQKSLGVNEVKSAIDEYRTAEHSAQLSLAKFLESKGATVGHASSQRQAEILEVAARAGRRTRSDDGVAEDSDDSESLAGSGNAQEEESNSGRSTWFARVASPFKGRE